MSDYNVSIADFKNKNRIVMTDTLYQYDYGQKLQIVNIAALPQTFEAHFSNVQHGGVSITVTGMDGIVDIPNSLLMTGKRIYCWIYVTEPGSGETVYQILLPVQHRPMPEYYDVTDVGVFDSVVQQVGDYAATATAGATSATASATAAAASADSAAASASAAESAKTAAETAQGKAEDAQAAAETAAQTATEKAQQTAQDAAQAALYAGRAESAADRAETAETGAEAAKTAAQTAANQSASYAGTASEKAALAEQSAEAAAVSATAAAQSAASIEGDVQTATAKAAEATAAANQAVAAKDAAVTAQQGAEISATNAGQSASTATAKASEAATSASNAAASETAAEAAATRAEQAAASLTVDSALSDTSVNPVQNKVVTGAVAQVKSAIDEQIIYPENTIFADRIASSAQLLDYEDALPNIKKYESLVYNNGRFITSSGTDSYCFRTPYDGFTFAVYMRSTDYAYTVDKIPEGVVNEVVNATLLSGTTLDNVYTQYTISNRGTIVLFTHAKVFTAQMLSTALNHYTQAGLELNDIQDSFARYSVRGEDSTVIPVTVTKHAGKLVNTTTGAMSANASYDTYVFRCPVSAMSVTCTNGFRAVLTNADPAGITENGHLDAVIYTYASGRVNTFSAGLNQYVAIAVANATNPTIDLKTDLVKSFSLPTLRLGYGQKNSFYKFEKNGSASYLYIYYVSGEKIVGWELHNVPSAGSNSNTWQIGHVMGYDFDGTSVSNGVELVGGGEFELAFKEYGAADYCGGNNHGDENTIDFTLMIDGKTADLANMPSGYHAFDRIDAIEHAYVNRCDTPAENILKHQKVWTFEVGTVKVRQTLEFLESLECDFLCCMLAANRSAFTHGVRQGRVGTEDMSTSSFDRVHTDGNEMMYLMYGTNATAKVTARCEEHTPAASLWINNASTINKLYYNFYGQLPRTSVASGTVVHWESEYDIAYN